MKSITPIAPILIAFAFTAVPAVSQQPSRSVNVTTDSAPGWIPTEEQETAAQQTVLNFLQAEDQGRYAGAYALLTPAMKSYLSMDQLTANEQEFHVKAGSFVSRRILKVTWTKDPANAPFPGAYAAIDVTARYANVDRQCGYVVVYQQPSGGRFLVMREEKTFLDNKTAAKLKADGRSVDEIWTQVSRVCPNYSPAEPAS